MFDTNTPVARTLESLTRGVTPCFLTPHVSGDADLDILRSEWNKIGDVDWKNYFQDDIPKSSVALWTAVCKYELGGVRKFLNIAEFVMKMLSAPLSNATVERAFSIINITTTKIRNRMQTKMLEALLRAKMWARGVRCCSKFNPTPRMYKLFTKDMYDGERAGKAELSESETDEILECFHE